jgi:hypothetical protein
MDQQRNWSYNKLFFSTVALVFCCICLFIFYSQATSRTGYPSDLRAHVGFAMNPGNYGAAGYSFLHQFVMVLAKFFSFLRQSREIVYSVLMILTLTASLLISVLIIRNYFHKRYKDINPYFIDFMSLSLMVVSMIIINPFSHPYYLGTGTPNPWHNPTYIFCKPFSILVFLFLVKAFDNFNLKTDYLKELIFLSFFSVLSMWAKPSFLMSFLPTIAIVLIYKFLKNDVSFKFLFLVALSLLPSLIPFFIMNNTIYNASNPTNTIIVALGKVWGNHSKFIPLSIVLAMAFPLYVFILKVKKLSTPHLLAFINYIAAMLIYFILAENGKRMYHGNFSWGYMFGMFFLFFVSIEEFFFRDKVSTVLYKIGWGFFLLHLVSGLFYLSVIAAGGSYF